MLVTTLRILAVACGAAALTHTLLGVGGDWVVGAPVGDPIDATLDSQNRFYGAAFGLYGVLLWMSASDVRRFAPVLRAVLIMMFAGACARGLAVLAHGWPSVQVMGLWATEVFGPPVVWVWLNRVLRDDAA
jgi:hypothetical protein